MVQRIVGVRFHEEEDKTQHDSVYADDRIPVSLQNVQANIPEHVNVRVIYLRVAVALRCVERKGWRHCHCKLILPTFPNAVHIRKVDVNLEIHDVLRVWENYDCVRGQVQLLDILSKSQLTGALLQSCWYWYVWLSFLLIVKNFEHFLN